MLQLDDVRVFAKVAELASFTQAAGQLGLAKGRVSTIVQLLESQVGARLLQRTTRRVSLTSDGQQFLDSCKTLLSEAELLQNMFRPASSGLQGSVRIDMPNTLARELFIPKLPDFLAAHPALEVGIGTTDRRVDLVREGYDCVLRLGPVPDSDLVARRLGVLRRRNVASPAYLQRHGTPTTLAELARHKLIYYTSNLNARGAAFEMEVHGANQSWPMHVAITVNGADAHLAACIAGLGISQALVRSTEQLIATGALLEILPQFSAAPVPVTLLYPHRRHIPPRVQAVMQWLASVLEQQT